MNHSIIYGLLIGILLGILFKKLNIKYKGASSNKMKKYIYQYKKKCYKFNTEITICTPKILLE
jgi:hypothetical protein